jgi:integrase/recombinase XerC
VRQTFSEDELVPPKGGAERAVPMLPELAELLREATRGKQPGDFVLLEKEGEVPSRQTYLARLKAFQKRAGLRDWGSHSLRHYFCSQLMRNGANIEAVRSLLGHSKVATTPGHAHATLQDLHDAVGELDSRTGNRVETS